MSLELYLIKEFFWDERTQCDEFLGEMFPLFGKLDCCPYVTALFREKIAE